MLKNIQKFILGLSCAFFLTACQQPKKEPVATVKEENTVTTQEAIPGAGNTVTIRSIGDILLHDGVYYNGQQGDGTYNFDFMLEPVAPYLKNADITTANMETIVAGHQLGLSTYPQFNAPEEIVDTLLNVGVDIV